MHCTRTVPPVIEADRTDEGGGAAVVVGAVVPGADTVVSGDSATPGPPGSDPPPELDSGPGAGAAPESPPGGFGAVAVVARAPSRHRGGGSRRATPVAVGGAGDRGGGIAPLVGGRPVDTSAACPMRAVVKLAGVVTLVPATSMATIDAVMASSRARPPTPRPGPRRRRERGSAMASVCGGSGGPAS